MKGPRWGPGRGAAGSHTETSAPPLPLSPSLSPASPPPPSHPTSPSQPLLLDTPTPPSSSSSSPPGAPGAGRYLLIDSQGLPYTVLVAERGVPGGSFRCPVCGRSFAYLSYLQRHSIAHSALKPHACRACGKAFKRRSHLERHKLTHGGRDPGGTPAAPPRHACPPVGPRRCRHAGELERHRGGGRAPHGSTERPRSQGGAREERLGD